MLGLPQLLGLLVLLLLLLVLVFLLVLVLVFLFVLVFLLMFVRVLRLLVIDRKRDPMTTGRLRSSFMARQVRSGPVMPFCSSSRVPWAAV